MRARTALILVGSALVAVVAGCIDVPSGIKANFAAAGPEERSNFRRGAHGSALPTEEPAPAPVAPPEAKAAQADAGPASGPPSGSEPVSQSGADGGSS